MNALSMEKQVRVIAHLVEGNSIRSTERLTGVHRDTVMRLGVRIGEGCDRIHDKLMVNLHVNVLEVDELWAFVGKKQGHKKPDGAHSLGDSYTFLGLDATRKAIVSYTVGKRDLDSTEYFIDDLRKRVINRPQITSDGFRPYIAAIDNAFGVDVDYAQIVKQYKGAASADAPAEKRYSPARIISTERIRIMGYPDDKKISTSFVERTNLSVRMSSRRFTRLTNAHSKKLRNHAAAVGLLVAYYNLCRVHATLRVTPAMAIGVTDHVWSIEELIQAAIATEGEIPPTDPTTPTFPTPAPKAGPTPSKAHPRLKILKGGRDK